MNAVANVQVQAVNNCEVVEDKPEVVEIASARNFHTYVRRATDEELQATERQLRSDLAKFDASGIRTQLEEIIKERLMVITQALSLSH
jgi:hypothetical protein